jgi:hypothetical protein
MTFTQEDAENDGLIKREVGQELNAVLSRQGSELYRLFTEWCNETGRNQSRVLGDMALRSMRDEAFAQELSGVVIDLGKLKGNQIREEDLDMVMDLIDKLDGQDDGGSGAMGSIDRMIEKRIEAMGSGPLGGVADNVNQSDTGDGQNSEINEMEQRLQRIEQAVIGQQQQERNGTQSQDSGSGGQDVDDLFEGLGGGGADSDENEADETGATVEVNAETDDSGTETGDEDSEVEQGDTSMFSTENTIEK